MDLTDHEQEQRRARLREWVRTRGGHTSVVAARRLTPSQASYLSQVINGYSFGPRSARNMEQRLGMPPRWLDLTDTHSDARPLSAGEQPPTAYIAPSGQQPHITLTQALEQLGIELARDMATEVREDVADALRKMALRRGAQHDQDQVRALLASTPGKRRPAP